MRTVSDTTVPSHDISAISCRILDAVNGSSARRNPVISRPGSARVPQYVRPSTRMAWRGAAFGPVSERAATTRSSGRSVRMRWQHTRVIGSALPSTPGSSSSRYGRTTDANSLIQTVVWCGSLLR